MPETEWENSLCRQWLDHRKAHQYRTDPYPTYQATVPELEQVIKAGKRKLVDVEIRVL
jgi:IS1 family transposase